MSTVHLFLLFLLFGITQTGLASNIEREMRLTQEVLAGFIDGEALFLNADKDTQFLALHTKTEREVSKGLVILLHGRGLHSNWHNVIQPVRSLLPEYGWDTLSIQMPVLDKDAKIDDYIKILPESPSRVDAAINKAKALGYDSIYILSHSCGSQMALYWLKQQKKPVNSISGLVHISLGIGTYFRAHNEYPSFIDTELPILDVYGELGILNNYAELRKKQIQQSGHPMSQQFKVKSADDFFVEKGEELGILIKNWLNQLSSSS